MSDRNMWEVPLIIWMSESYKFRNALLETQLRKAVSRRLQSDQLLFGLLRFAGVTGLGVEGKLDFLDDEFEERNPRVIMNGKGIYDELPQ